MRKVFEEPGKKETSDVRSRIYALVGKGEVDVQGHVARAPVQLYLRYVRV